MTAQSVTRDRADLQVRRLYEEAFPPEERIPWDDLMHLVDAMPLDFLAFYESNRLVGLFIVYPRPSFNWVWYFAVPQELRGQGIGRTILLHMLNKYSHSNIVDLESPEQVCDNAEQRRRRYEFYLRNGFRDTGVGRSFKGIDYTIMMQGPGTFTMQDYDLILSELRSFWEAMPSPGE